MFSELSVGVALPKMTNKRVVVNCRDYAYFCRMCCKYATNVHPHYVRHCKACKQEVTTAQARDNLRKYDREQAALMQDRSRWLFCLHNYSNKHTKAIANGYLKLWRQNLRAFEMFYQMDI